MVAASNLGKSSTSRSGQNHLSCRRAWRGRQGYPVPLFGRHKGQSARTQRATSRRQPDIRLVRTKSLSPGRSSSMKFTKFAGVVIAVAILAICAYYVRALWYAREAGLPGMYRAEGAWGRSTLELDRDHTLKQSVSFTNHFTGKPEGTKTASGSWSDLERSLSSRKFELSSFVNPSPSAQQSVVPSFDAEYKAFGTSFGIEIDPGASIYYWKDN